VAASSRLSTGLTPMKASRSLAAENMRYNAVGAPTSASKSSASTSVRSLAQQGDDDDKELLAALSSSIASSGNTGGGSWYASLPRGRGGSGSVSFSER